LSTSTAPFYVFSVVRSNNITDCSASWNRCSSQE